MIKRQIWISTGVLLGAAAALFLHADDLSMWFDELWSMFQNSHSLGHILHEPELNWPVGHAVVLHVWTRLISSHDFVVHVLGALVGLLGTAFMIQAGRTLDSAPAGWLAGLAFGTSSYALYFLLEARGYGLLLTLSAAVVCCYARWLRQPTWRRAVPYALAQILVMYAHFTAGLILGLIGLHALITMPRQRWPQWIAIMVTTAVGFLPQLPHFLDAWTRRTTNIDDGTLPNYLLYGPETIYRAYSAHQDLWWGVILVLALIGLGLLVRGGSSRQRWTVLWLVAWGLGIPVYAYVTRETSALFSTRYLAFTLPAIMLLIGLGLARLPRRGWAVGGALLLIFALFPWQPFDHRPSYSNVPPVRDLVRELAKRFQAGDRLVIDPALLQDTGYDWWYYEPLYVTGGRFPRAANGDEAGARVWYLVRQGMEDPAIKESVERGRYAAEFWGPWYLIVTLYEGAPLDPGVRVGDTVRFRGADIVTGRFYSSGDTVAVESWWGADSPPPADYSIGLHVLSPDGTQVIAQSDSGPTGPYTPAQTSAWGPGGAYRDDRQVRLPWCLKPGYYQVRLVIYQSSDNTRLEPEPGDWRGPDSTITLGVVRVDSFAYCY